MPVIDVIAREVVPAEFLELIEMSPLPGLGEGPQCDATRTRIDAALVDSPMKGTRSEAALWLLAGELERSHEISQSDDAALGSLWHGIMHRREGDFWNSKYWFRKVKSHPVHIKLAGKLAETENDFSLPLGDLTNPSKLPEALVDHVEMAIRTKPEWVADLQKITWWEWQLAFEAGL